MIKENLSRDLARSALSALSEKSEQMACFGFLPRHRAEKYCLLPEKTFDAVVEYLFYPNAIENLDKCICLNGFLLIRANVDEIFFVGDV